METIKQSIVQVLQMLRILQKKVDLVKSFRKIALNTLKIKDLSVINPINLLGRSQREVARPDRCRTSNRVLLWDHLMESQAKFLQRMEVNLDHRISLSNQSPIVARAPSSNQATNFLALMNSKRMVVNTQ